MNQLLHLSRWALRLRPLDLRSACIPNLQITHPLSTQPAPPPPTPTPSHPPTAESAAPTPPSPPTPLTKPAEWYSTLPHIMDANSKEPLKSSEYASSHDDVFGVQKNWFTALYKQLNYFAKTGRVPDLKGRQKQVFESVEREFEGLYDQHIKASGLKGVEHRAMLMVCLSIATSRVLNNEIPDPTLVSEIIRTNQGSLMMGLLLPLHRFRIWVLRHLLGEEAYRQAVRFLPAMQSDMGALCEGEIQAGPQGAAQAQELPGSSSAGASTGPSPAALQGADEVSLVIRRCRYHEVLSAEDAPHLLADFCCSHGMTWLREFSAHGVDVSQERCMAWEDECCSIRLARRKAA